MYVECKIDNRRDESVGIYSSEVTKPFSWFFIFFFQAEDGIRDLYVTGVQTCALPIWSLSPSFSAVERRIITSAAAPSEIELEFAAVTVPSLRNAGLSVGIFSKLALNGPSSCSMKRSFLPVLTAAFTFMGVVSQANAPFRFAACARSSDAIAILSCSSRLKLYFAAQSSAKLPINLPLS